MLINLFNVILISPFLFTVMHQCHLTCWSVCRSRGSCWAPTISQTSLSSSLWPEVQQLLQPAKGTNLRQNRHWNFLSERHRIPRERSQGKFSSHFDSLLKLFYLLLSYLFRLSTPSITTRWCWRNTPMLPISRPIIWSMDWPLWLRRTSTTPTTKGNSSRRATGLVTRDTSALATSFMLAHSGQWMSMENGGSSSKKTPGPDTPRLNASKLVCSPVHLVAPWPLVLAANVCKNMFTSGCFPSILAIPRRESSSTSTSCHRPALATFPVNCTD